MKRFPRTFDQVLKWLSILNINNSFEWFYTATLQQIEIYAWWNALVKCFKICHILCIWKKNSSILYCLQLHSSEIRGLCLMKCPSEMLQNLPYFIYTKTQSWFFHFSFCATLIFSLMNALVYVDINQAIHKKKLKNARNEKQKKTTWVFLFIKYGKFWSISLEH